MSNTDKLVDLATNLRDLIVANWPADAVELPDRFYINNGAVAFDCEQLTIAIERLFPFEADVTSETMQTEMPGLAMRGAQAAITILRCAPGVDTDAEDVVLPTPEEIEAAAVPALEDCMALLTLMLDAHAQGLITNCHGLSFVEWIAEPPEGGFSGGTSRFRIALL